MRRQAEGREDARRLMTHPGVGWQTALAMVLTLGEVSRFENAGKVCSYLGLIPGEYSSGNRQRLGHISKQFPRRDCLACQTGGSHRLFHLLSIHFGGMVSRGGGDARSFCFAQDFGSGLTPAPKLGIFAPAVYGLCLLLEVC